MNASPERMQELAADRVLWGLSESEEQELAGFGSASQVEVDEFELAGAAIAAAMVQATADQPPPHVQARLRWAASNFLAGRDEAAPSETGSGDRAASPVAEVHAARRRGMPAWSGWVAAAAAAIVALVLWVERARTPSPVSPEARLQAFLDEHPDAQRRSWEVGPGGDVVWSASASSGFLVIDELPVNDGSFQYQLWIFDRGRSTDHPVDGGVFDIEHTGRTVIPIDAKIAVDDAFGFAITKERPGGVVVSDRENVVAAVGV